MFECRFVSCIPCNDLKTVTVHCILPAIRFLVFICDQIFNVYLITAAQNSKGKILNLMTET